MNGQRALRRDGVGRAEREAAGLTGDREALDRDGSIGAAGAGEQVATGGATVFEQRDRFRCIGEAVINGIASIRFNLD